MPNCNPPPSGTRLAAEDTHSSNEGREPAPEAVNSHGTAGLLRAAAPVSRYRHWL